MFESCYQNKKSVNKFLKTSLERPINVLLKNENCMKKSKKNLCGRRFRWQHYRLMRMQNNLLVHFSASSVTEVIDLILTILLTSSNFVTTSIPGFSVFLSWGRRGEKPGNEIKLIRSAQVSAKRPQRRRARRNGCFRRLFGSWSWRISREG